MFSIATQKIQNKLIIPLIFFALFYKNNNSVQGATDLYTLKVTQIKCFDINPKYILNVTCNVKAERHKYGLINLYWMHRNVDRLVVYGKLFYQNSAGHFLPTFLDYCYDFCEWNELAQNGPKLFQYVVNLKMPSDVDKVKHEKRTLCPLNVI